jgi:hypothetical protein
MKKILAYIIIVIFTAGFKISLNAQVVFSWVANTGGVSIALDNSNNVYTINYDYSPGGDISLTKRNSSGIFQWQVYFDQTDITKWEKAAWVETDNDVNTIVAGTLMSGYSNPVVAASIIMKFNSQGTLLWRQVYENSFDGSQTKKCLIDEQNNIYVLGTGINGSYGMNLKVKKFAPDGTALWTYFNTAGIGMPLNFKFTPDNCIVVTGRGITGSVNGYAKLDKNGNGLWSIPGVFSTTTGDAAGDEFGNTYIVNLEYIFNPTKSIVKKISPAGTEIWSSNYTVCGLRVEVGTDNMPVISGYPNPNSFGSSFVKFNPSGGVVWANMDADSSYSLMMHAQMKMDNQNNIYLAAGLLTAMAVCKVKSDGSSGWTITAPGSYANALEIGSDNSIYVVGGNTAGATGRIVQSLTAVTNNGNTIPGSFGLGQNYPNPFNPVTKIDYHVSKSSFVRMTVYNSIGEEVKQLVNSQKAPGSYSIEFDGSDLSSGMYFYKFETDGLVETRKMLLVK